jgi:hypothetical protein
MKIVNFGQVVDLEHGTQIAHQFTVMLPTGQRLQVRTDEGTVQQLVEALTGNGAAPQPSAQPRTLGEMLEQEAAATPQIEAEDDFDDAGEVFGGDYDPGELAAAAAGGIAEEPDYEPEAVMGTVSSEPAMAPATPQGGLGQPQQPKRPPKRPHIDKDGFFMPVKSRTVPKDEMGYPIVKQRAAPPQTVPDDDGEDDGQQI